MCIRLDTYFNAAHIAFSALEKRMVGVSNFLWNAKSVQRSIALRETTDIKRGETPAITIAYKTKDGREIVREHDYE